MERSNHKTVGKLRKIIGFGGIDCPCCTIGPKSITKHWWNKISRRLKARELDAEIKAVTEDTLLDEEETRRFWEELE